MIICIHTLDLTPDYHPVEHPVDTDLDSNFNQESTTYNMITPAYLAQQQENNNHDAPTQQADNQNGLLMGPGTSQADNDPYSPVQTTGQSKPSKDLPHPDNVYGSFSVGRKYNGRDLYLKYVDGDSELWVRADTLPASHPHKKHLADIPFITRSSRTTRPPSYINR